jgi:type I phosphodiesterase/nucleotide pyrophosphatase
MPVDAASVAAVDGARLESGRVRPLATGYTFAAIPTTIERLLVGGVEGLPAGALGDAPERVGRVVLVLLDAFGWRFFERYADDHPLLRRFLADGTVAKLTSQFPSTTTAHITTLHTGRPVTDHGLYEWNLYEPSIDALITPLMFAFAGDGRRDTLRVIRADPRAMFPTETLYQRLASAGVRSIAYQPASFAPSTYDGVLLDGADMRPYPSVERAFATLAEDLAAATAPVYAYVYIDAVDAIGHQRGPSSEAFDAVARHCLDTIDRALGTLPAGTLLLLAADHGQVDVDPARTRFVNEMWPAIRSHLRRDRRGRPVAPAGSARDLVLHTLSGARDHVIAALRDRVGDIAEVRATDDLVAEGVFAAHPGPRLRERLGDVLVLPAPGETVWWRESRRFDMRFRGHHGGLTPEEAHTLVASLVVE